MKRASTRAGRAYRRAGNINPLGEEHAMRWSTSRRVGPIRVGMSGRLTAPHPASSFGNVVLGVAGVAAIAAGVWMAFAWGVL